MDDSSLAHTFSNLIAIGSFCKYEEVSGSDDTSLVKLGRDKDSFVTNAITNFDSK